MDDFQCFSYTVLCRQEIYPPKMSEYAFLTAEACTEEDMKQCEVIMLKVRHLLPIINFYFFLKRR